MDVCKGTNQCRYHNSTINCVLRLMKYFIYLTTLSERHQYFVVSKRFNLENKYRKTDCFVKTRSFLYIVNAINIQRSIVIISQTIVCSSSYHTLRLYAIILMYL